MPKEESFPIPLKYIDVMRSQLIQIWMSHKTNELTTNGMSMETEVCHVRLMDRLHEIYDVERNSSKTIHVVPEGIDKNSNDIMSRSHMA